MLAEDTAVIETFFATGARVRKEVSNIRADNVNLNTGLIRIMGKGGRSDISRSLRMRCWSCCGDITA